MTQEALAAAAGMDRSFLVDVETGRHSLMLDRLFDLAAALNASAADLIADS
ncbi:MAG: helix-turn-helix domain-containing protein [Actinobacteria bacterium]|nr:helix-turn-helix domain-containing protein [Actinomycetota bacterium]